MIRHGLSSLNSDGEFRMSILWQTEMKTKDKKNYFICKEL